MAYLEIPVRSDLPAYEFQIELEKQIFYLTFAWNDRGSKWVMGIMDANKTPLVMGIPVLASWLLFSKYQVDGLPLGDFFALDTSGQNKDPAADDFGSRVVLVYRESTTTPAEEASTG